MRLETKSAAWQGIPVRIAVRRRRVLTVGQFNRSLVFVASALAAVVMIALMPVDDTVGVSAPHDSTAAAALTGRSVLHFPQ